jgi:hypothetical protein
MYACITTYKGFLVFELLVKSSIDGKVTSSIDNPGTIGQIIHDTKNNLGISNEALQLLKTIKCSNDSIGDLDWFETPDGCASFGWIGGPFSIKNLEKCESSLTYEILDCVTIDNCVSKKNQNIIDYY